MSKKNQQLVRVGHSPDPDDAFMFYGISCGAVPTAPYEIQQVLEDIESLNRMATAGELEVSAVSIHAYAHLADRYALMPCGASMGDGYGPCIVAREALAVDELTQVTFAVPGTLTSAFLALRLFLGQSFSYRPATIARLLACMAARATNGPPVTQIKRIPRCAKISLAVSIVGSSPSGSVRSVHPARPRGG